MEYLSDFTLTHYREVLSLAKQKFAIRTMSDEQTNGTQTLILRHDIDISPQAAYNVAQVENEMGITSSYYVLLHSPFYNALDATNIALIKKIIDLNHEVGLHFDSHFFGINNEQDLAQHLTLEKELLEKYVDVDVKSFSFHLTNEFTKSCNKAYYAGLINSLPVFFQNDLVYCSDSYGIWRFKRLYDYLLNTEQPLIQILTHPEWWVFQPMDAEQRMHKHIQFIQQRLSQEAQKNYLYKPTV
jgi:hypothetical protein